MGVDCPEEVVVVEGSSSSTRREGMRRVGRHLSAWGCRVVCVTPTPPRLSLADTKLERVRMQCM